VSEGVKGGRRWFVGSLVRWFVGSFVRWFVGSLVRWFVGSLVRYFVTSLVRLVGWGWGIAAVGGGAGAVHRRRLRLAVTASLGVVIGALRVAPCTEMNTNALPGLSEILNQVQDDEVIGRQWRGFLVGVAGLWVGDDGGDWAGITGRLVGRNGVVGCGSDGVVPCGGVKCS